MVFLFVANLPTYFFLSSSYDSFLSCFACFFGVSLNKNGHELKYYNDKKYSHWPFHGSELSKKILPAPEITRCPGSDEPPRLVNMNTSAYVYDTVGEDRMSIGKKLTKQELKDFENLAKEQAKQEAEQEAKEEAEQEAKQLKE